VICVDADVPDSRRVLYIGTDNLKAAERAEADGGAGSRKRKHCGYYYSRAGQSGRSLGRRADALKNFPAMKLTKIIDDKGDWRNAFDQISDMIVKKERIDGIICLEATGGPGLRMP